MSELENLESSLLASRKISDYLKNFSQTQWVRIIKASIILGIQDLERNHSIGGNINHLFSKDIEDIVVRNEQETIFK